MPAITQECKHCHKVFTTYRSPAYLTKHPVTHCSKACFMADWQKSELFICEECGEEFTAIRTPARPNPRFCSMTCRNKNVAAIVDFVCQECGKVFQRHQSMRRKYCSKTCAGKHSYVVGRNPRPIYGDCKQCGKQLTKAQHEGENAFCSRSCLAAFRMGLSTSQYMAMIEGLDPDNMPNGYRGPNWTKQRNNARYRDGYQCQRCGISEEQLGRQLDVHHIKPFHEYGLVNYKAANQLANLMSVCVYCHRAIEPRGCIS